MFDTKTISSGAVRQVMIFVLAVMGYLNLFKAFAPFSIGILHDHARSAPLEDYYIRNRAFKSP